MINPSAPGWIDKFFVEQKIDQFYKNLNEAEFYLRTRATGFIFGHIVSFDAANLIPITDRLPDEISKIGMLSSLYEMYCITRNDIDPNNFITEGVAFYNLLTPKGFYQILTI